MREKLQLDYLPRPHQQHPQFNLAQHNHPDHIIMDIIELEEIALMVALLLFVRARLRPASFFVD